VRTTFLRAAVLVLPVMLAVGCGGGSPSLKVLPIPLCTPSTKPEFAYVLNGDAVSMYTVDSCTGGITTTTLASVETRTSPKETNTERNKTRQQNKQT
jgi:hypothetical protein